MTKMTNSLVIAFVYESQSAFLARGYTAEAVSEMTHDAEIDGIAHTLTALGHRVAHVPGIEALVTHLADPTDHAAWRTWDLVFNMSEGVRGAAREAQVPALLEAYGVLYTFADAATMAVCLDKARTKILLEHYNIPTAPFAVVSASDDTAQAAIRASRHAAALQSRFPLFVKPNAEGTSKGICPASRVHTAADLEHTVATLRQRCPGQALLIEPYLAGRELTVGIVGTGRRARVVGVVEYRWNQSQEGREDFFYWQNKVDAWDGVVQQVAVDVQSSPVVQEVCRMALAAWTVLHCRDGGRVDVRLDREGSPYILEVNPIAGLCPGYSVFPQIAEENGMSYAMLLEGIVSSALERRQA